MKVSHKCENLRKTLYWDLLILLLSDEYCLFIWFISFNFIVLKEYSCVLFKLYSKTINQFQNILPQFNQFQTNKHRSSCACNGSNPVVSRAKILQDMKKMLCTFFSFFVCNFCKHWVSQVLLNFIVNRITSKRT